VNIPSFLQYSRTGTTGRQGKHLAYKNLVLFIPHSFSIEPSRENGGKMATQNHSKMVVKTEDESINHIIFIHIF